MRTSLIVILLLFSALTEIDAQQAPAPGEPDVNALAKASQNPVADMVSVPFQFNLNSGGGLQDRTFLLLNFQPVIPFKLTDDWNMIVRTIVPIVSIPGPTFRGELVGPRGELVVPRAELDRLAFTRFSGIADIVMEIFISPSKAKAFIWGVGPAFSLPAATTIAAETGSWAAGPTAVALVIKGPWVVGAVGNNLWTFSDTGGEPEVNSFLLQWFVNYNFDKGWAISTGPVITANWDAAPGDRWTVPLGLGISRTTVFNHRPMVVGLQIYHNVERPRLAAANTVRFFVTLLYPKK
jgi:hypothetical protein